MGMKYLGPQPVDDLDIARLVDVTGGGGDSAPNGSVGLLATFDDFESPTQVTLETPDLEGTVVTLTTLPIATFLGFLGFFGTPSPARVFVTHGDDAGVYDLAFTGTTFNSLTRLDVEPPYICVWLDSQSSKHWEGIVVSDPADDFRIIPVPRDLDRTNAETWLSAVAWGAQAAVDPTITRALSLTGTADNVWYSDTPLPITDLNSDGLDLVVRYKMDLTDFEAGLSDGSKYWEFFTTFFEGDGSPNDIVADGVDLLEVGRLGDAIGEYGQLGYPSGNRAGRDYLFSERVPNGGTTEDTSRLFAEIKVPRDVIQEARITLLPGTGSNSGKAVQTAYVRVLWGGDLIDSDGRRWKQIGQVISSTAWSLPSTTNPIVVGKTGRGYIYFIEARHGLDGPLFANPNPSSDTNGDPVEPGQGSFEDDLGIVWTAFGTVDVVDLTDTGGGGGGGLTEEEVIDAVATALTPGTATSIVYNDGAGTITINDDGSRSFDVGNGTDDEIIVTHGLGTRDVLVSVRRATSPYDQVVVDNEATSTTEVTLFFDTPPTSDEYRVTVRR